MGVSIQNDLLKVVRPGGRVEVFREPITAGELMRKYPRHCIARPDVFKFPWIVVHPESVLVPGRVFYLLPYYTLNNLLKRKRQQQTSSEQKQSQEALLSYQETISRNYPLLSYHRNVNQESSGDSLYKLEFYKTWNKISTSLNHEFQDELDLFPENSELLRLKSCLKKADSTQKKLNVKVTFASPVSILIN